MRLHVGLELVRKAVAWILLATSLFFLLTGFGISNSSVVDGLTFGLLGKAESFKVHEVLWIPFLLLLVLHVTLNVFIKRRKK